MKKVILFTASLAASLMFTSCSEAAETASHAADEAHQEVAAHTEEVMDKAEEMTKPEVKTIKLEQITGEFTTKELTLDAGTYSFEVTNSGIEHPVAFVLAPSKENLEQADWIADAMLTQAIEDGQTASSKKAVTLEKGEYLYFCPMNPTPQYKLTVN